MHLTSNSVFFIRGSASTVSKDEVIEVLKTVYGLEIPINIVDLGLVYGVDVEGDRVHIRMTLAKVGCSRCTFIPEEVRKKVEAIEGVQQAKVELVWDPPWTPERISDRVPEDVKKQIM
ncbi:metal-sulfur cluster assembly factor [Methanosarcina sp. Mfa9]|uniref:metal-sulfur cluster assembly factor n=1 Tax=Methanosarcina sp. Mfa9 TaxID=3439063 RepID=UPI003F856E53